MLMLFLLWTCGQRGSAVHQIHSLGAGKAAVMDRTKARRKWVELYARTRDAGLVCRRCGISRPTLRKWWRRYQADGEAGLVDCSRRPHRLAAQKVFSHEEAIILSLRRERRLGVKQLRNELIRQHDLTLSLDTIHRTLVRNG